MKARLNLFAHAPICAVFLAASFAGAAAQEPGQAAATDTSKQVVQCQSGRDDCLTRPQAECGPGLNDCLSGGQSDCKNQTAASTPAASHAAPNTANIDKALQNPHLTPQQRERLVKAKGKIATSSQTAAPNTTGIQYFQCLQNVTNQCRATHC